MVQRKIQINYGINGAFLTRRWEEPENFMRLTAECGYRYHSFCADVLDPFFSGDKKYQLKTCAKIKSAAEKYNITIVDYYTGVATHRFHGLSHSDKSVREKMKQWIIEAMDIAIAIGTYRIGGHWDAFSVEVMSDPIKTEKAKRNIYNQFKELCNYAKDKGIKTIYNEQMYIPSEKPWTIKEAEEFLIEVNKDNKGIPLRLTIDTGHQAGQSYGQKGKDIDYIEWLKTFSAFSEIIHVQQTTVNASHHWPFTEQYNKIGHVSIKEIIEAIKYSHNTYLTNPVSKYLGPVEKIYLIAEIIPGSTETEETLINGLKTTAEHFKKYIPEKGLEINI